MSAHDGVELIDATIADIESTWSKAERGEARKLELLAIREAITRDADWSEVMESNLRTQLDAAVARADAAAAEAAEEQATHEAEEAALRAQVQAAKDDAAAVHVVSEIAAALYDGVIADLERKLESARRIAVALEQENAEEIDDPPDAEPCAAELFSWNYFRPEQTDGYYMRCHKVGPHTEHENSETGAHWTDAVVPR